MTINYDIFDGATGGGRLSQDDVRSSVVEPVDLVLNTALDRRLARLLALHPELQVKFRNHDLASLDDETKESLLEDLNEILQINKLVND